MVDVIADRDSIRFVDCNLRDPAPTHGVYSRFSSTRSGGQTSQTWSTVAMPVGKQLLEAQMTLGYEAFILTAIVPDGFKPSRWCIVSNVDPEYFKNYANEKLGFRDPVLNWSLKNVEPFTWNDIDGFDADLYSAYNKLNQRFGLVSGITVPVRCPNGVHCFVSFASSASTMPLSSGGVAESKLRAFGQSAMALQLFSTIVLADIRYREELLSARERECLILSAQGMRSKQIAAHLSLSISTVAFHIDRAVKKMGVNTRSAAIGKAVATGQIQRPVGDGVIHFKNCESDLAREGVSGRSII